MSVFGVDFGTSNTVVAYNDGLRTKILDIDNDLSGEKVTTLPSALFFHESKEIFYGWKAISKYLEDYESGRYMQSLKSLLTENQYSGTIVYGRTRTFQEIITTFLKGIKIISEKVSNDHMDFAVIGRPVHFSFKYELDSYAVNLLKDIAQFVGVKNIRFQYEPIAAALAYEKRLGEKEIHNVLVVDMGGGTSDFTIFRARGSTTEAHDRSKDIIAVGGVRFGGDTIDSLMFWEFLAKHFGKGSEVRGLSLNRSIEYFPSTILSPLKEWHQLPFLREPKVRNRIREVAERSMDQKLMKNLETLIDYNLSFELFQKIEKAKRVLSIQDEAKIEFNVLGVVINEIITRKAFEKILENKVALVISQIEELIAKSGLHKDQIHTVFLTGKYKIF